MKNGQQRGRGPEGKTTNKTAEPVKLTCPTAGRTIRDTVWIIIGAVVFSAAIWGIDRFAVWITGRIL